MAHYVMTRSDFEGYGVYAYDGVGIGQVPDLGSLSQYERVNGLAHVPKAYEPMAKQLLDQMVFTKTDLPELGGVTGEASFILGSTGGGWVDGLVHDGYVVMIERATVPTGHIRVVASSVPATVVLLAGQTDPHFVIVDADGQALAAAEAYARGQAPIPGGGTPVPPGVPEPPPGARHAAPCTPEEAERAGWCYPIPGGVEPEPTPGPQPGPTKMAGWVLPAAIGASAIALVAVFAAKSKPALTPNRRRRHHRRRPRR